MALVPITAGADSLFARAGSSPEARTLAGACTGPVDDRPFVPVPGAFLSAVGGAAGDTTRGPPGSSDSSPLPSAFLFSAVVLIF